MDVADQNLIEYIRKEQPLFDGKLGEVQKVSMQEGFPVIRPETARLLAVLLSLSPPLKVLEIGCAVGFSASLFCEYLKKGGRVTTIERQPVMIKKAKANFEYMGIEDRVSLLQGDALEILPQMQDEFDIIFLDAAKAQYINFLPDCKRMLKIGGMLIADDILQGGTVAGSRLDVPRRNRTTYKRMNSFIQAICNDKNLETSLIPIGDGLSVSVKK